jgi:hypothetical protein
MTNGAQTPARNGLHPLAWVGIGCGVLVMIVAISFGAFLWWGYGKAKEAGLDPASLKEKAKEAGVTADDFRENPELAAVNLLLLSHPDIEAVNVDTEAGIVQVRNKKTGEVYSLSMDDIENGNIKLTAGDEEYNVNFSENEGGGTIRIEGSDGKGMEIATGAAVEGEWPDWVPIYPGTEPEGLGTMTAGDSINGTFSLSSPDGVAEVLDFYRDELSAAGFKVNVNTYSGNGHEGAMVNGSKEAEKTNVVVVISRDDGATKMSVTYSKRG